MNGAQQALSKLCPVGQKYFHQEPQGVKSLRREKQLNSSCNLPYLSLSFVPKKVKRNTS